MGNNDSVEAEQIDIGPLLEEHELKIHKLSLQDAELLKRINTTFIRLDIISLVLERVAQDLGISKAQLQQIASEEAEKLKKEYESATATPTA